MYVCLWDTTLTMYIKVSFCYLFHFFTDQNKS